MNRTIIVARIRPDAEPDVAEIFAKSDATSLPHELGVQQRTLYSLRDIYLHVIEFEQDPGRGAATRTRAARIPADQRGPEALHPAVRRGELALTAGRRGARVLPVESGRVAAHLVQELRHIAPPEDGDVDGASVPSAPGVFGIR